MRDHNKAIVCVVDDGQAASPFFVSSQVMKVMADKVKCVRVSLCVCSGGAAWLVGVCVRAWMDV